MTIDKNIRKLLIDWLSDTPDAGPYTNEMIVTTARHLIGPRYIHLLKSGTVKKVREKLNRMHKAYLSDNS